MKSRSILQRALTLILGTTLMALMAVTVISVSNVQQTAKAQGTGDCGHSCPCWLCPLQWT